VTVPPTFVVPEIGLVRVFEIVIWQMSCAMSSRIWLMSSRLPGKYPPGEAMAAFNAASSPLPNS
jgi:hypothetical protein